jgi:hypothetical protein
VRSETHALIARSIQPRNVDSVDRHGLVELLITPWAAVTPEKGCPTPASIQNVELNVRFFPFRDAKRGSPSSGRQALRVWRASSPRPNAFDMPNISKYCVCAAPQHLSH